VRQGWRGLLIDGDRQRVRFANRVLRKDPILRVGAECVFLNLDNLSETVRRFLGKDKLGVLSVDVDGNDYWFLEALMPLQPALMVVEYNASLGLRSLSVPYDAAFDRHKKHASGWYHGASLTALGRLAARHGYVLVAVSDAGGNAFFVRRDQADAVPFASLDAQTAYRENLLRNQWSGTTAADQWAVIEHLPYTEI
jgi:hypothetical protein